VSYINGAMKNLAPLRADETKSAFRKGFTSMEIKGVTKKP